MLDTLLGRIITRTSSYAVLRLAQGVARWKLRAR